jgi:hypothetical protein
MTLFKKIFSVASGRVIVKLAGGGLDADGNFRKRLAAERTSRTQNGAAFR